jgi:hypothetical protein
VSAKQAETNAKARTRYAQAQNLKQLRRNATKQDRLDPALQPRAIQSIDPFQHDTAMPLELMSDEDVTLALNDLRLTFGQHGADAVEAMTWGAVARWHCRVTRKVWHAQAAMIGVDASYRIIGKPELMPTWPADRQAEYRREASHALEAWSYAGSPGMKEAIELSQSWLLTNMIKDQSNITPHD